MPYDCVMKVFLFHYSYHKGKWSGRSSWPPKRIIAEDLQTAKEIFGKKRRGAGFRLDKIEDVTGKPHKIPEKTVF